MKSEVFLDTNILLYVADSRDPRSPTALRIVAAGGTISVQVLNEFVAVVRRKSGWDWPEVMSALARLRTVFPNPRAVGVGTHEKAVQIAAREGFRIYDSLLLASALEAGCTVFVSEDMQHGRVIDGRLTIRNPFLH